MTTKIVGGFDKILNFINPKELHLLFFPKTETSDNSIFRAPSKLSETKIKELDVKINLKKALQYNLCKFQKKTQN